MKPAAFLLCALTGMPILSAQPTLQWQKTLGGSQRDVTLSMIPAHGGGHLLSGYTESADGDITENKGNDDLLLVKTSVNGDIEWQHTYGGSLDDRAYAAEPTSDGGYIIVGFSESNDGDVLENFGDLDYWVLKVDAGGAIQWQKSFGGSAWDWATCVKQTSDGGFLVGGMSDSDDGDVTGSRGMFDYWLVKLNSNGDLLWQRSYGGSNDEQLRSIVLKPNGNALLMGFSTSVNGDVNNLHGDHECWLVEIDPTGNLLWSRTYGGSNMDAPNHLTSTPDGGYFFVGLSLSSNGDLTNNQGDLDAWVVKLDANYNIVWQRTLGGTSRDQMHFVHATPDGGCLMAGQTESNNGDVSGNHGQSDAWVVKLSSDGTTEWSKILGGSLNDLALVLTTTADQGILISGHTGSNDGDVSGNHGNQDVWLVKLGTTIAANEPTNPHFLEVAPNPASDVVNYRYGDDSNTVNAALFDAVGHMCASWNNLPSQGHLTLPKVATGRYVLKMWNRTSVSVKPLVVHQP